MQGVLLVFHRSCSVSKITSKLEENGLLYDVHNIDAPIQLPHRDKFSRFVSTLFGFQVSECDIDWIYEEFTMSSSSHVSIPTSCIVLRHLQFQELQSQMPKSICLFKTNPFSNKNLRNDFIPRKRIL